MLAKCACLISLGKLVKGYNPLHLVPSSCCGKRGEILPMDGEDSSTVLLSMVGDEVIDGGAVRDGEGEERWPFKDNSCQPQC